MQRPVLLRLKYALLREFMALNLLLFFGARTKAINARKPGLLRTPREEPQEGQHGEEMCIIVSRGG